MTDASYIRRAIEDLILEVEEGIGNNDLSKWDIANYSKREKHLNVRYQQAIKGDSKEALLVSRHYELCTILDYVSNNLLAENDLRLAIRALPKGADLFSEIARKWDANGATVSGFYVQRKMTISEHKQSIGNQTPAELTKNVVGLIILGLIVLLGMIITVQQNFLH